MENEIKVNDFVRTNDGYIGKVIKISEKDRDCDTYYSCDETMASGFYEHFKKHSLNLIDLIKVKDAIKYREQTEGREGTTLYDIYITDIHSEEELQEIKREIEINGIELLEIITHEQIETVSYKVERKD